MAENPIYAINRSTDAERLARFSAAAEAAGVSFTRIEAVDGHDANAPFYLYRDLLPERFWGGETIKPGAFGCYLSHAAAWRRMLADGAEMALICEDDAVLTGDPARLFAAARRRGDFDVIFANDRMSAWREAAALKSDPKTMEVGALAARMTAKGLAPGDGGLSKAPGADAYLVSRAGARKLLDNLARDRVAAGVDWMILARALAPGAVDWPELSLIHEAEPNLSVFASADPIARMEPTAGGSAVAHAIEAPIAALREARAFGEGGATAPARLHKTDPVAAAHEAGEAYEAPALELLLRWTPRGGVFVDIGAHSGGHTIFALLCAGAARAIPFEQNPFAADALREALAANGLSDRATLDHLGFGLGQERAKRQRMGNKRNAFVNRLKVGFDETVPIRAGDQLLRETPVDMIKVDVNGEEREALKGLRKTLRRQAPLVAIDLTRARSEKALPFLQRFGYEEAERATWTDGEGDRVFAIFRPTRPALKPVE